MTALLNESTVPLLSDDQAQLGRVSRRYWGLDKLEAHASSVFPFMVVWKGGSSVTGWLAQCFIQGENKTEIVETTWLLRIKVDACIDNWKSTMFGQDTFTHAEQRAGPRKKDDKHVPLDRDD